MIATLLAATLTLSVAQTPPPAPATERYDNAMRCAGVMAATSTLHAFTGDAAGKEQSDRIGRAFVTAAARYAQPLGLTQEQLGAAFTASTTTALGAITGAPDQAAADAAIDRLNQDGDACIVMARGWAAETSGTS